MVERLRRVFGELFGAVNDVLRDKGGYLDERIKRASELLRNDPELHRLLVPEAPNTAAADGCAQGGLMPWKARLIKHNAGEVSHTSKFKPWRLNTYVAFSDEKRAFAFENYLKTSSGSAFAKKRL